MINFKQNLVNLTADTFDKPDVIWLIYERAVTTLTLTMTMKAKPDVNPYKQINTRQYIGETIQSWEGKVLISHRFLWNGNAISTPKEHDSSSLNVDVDSSSLNINAIVHILNTLLKFQKTLKNIN